MLLLGAVGGVSAGTQLSIGEPSNNKTDGSGNVWYDTSTKTITFHAQYGYMPGWWFGAADYSSYETFVVKFSGEVSNKIQVLVECADGNIYGNNGDTHENTITVALDEKASSIRQIYFQLADELGDDETASVTFDDAYFETSSDRATLKFDLSNINSLWDSDDKFDKETYIATIANGVGFWSSVDVTLYKSAVFMWEDLMAWGGKLNAAGQNAEFTGDDYYAIVDISSATGELGNFVVQEWKHDPVRLKCAYLSTLSVEDEKAYIDSHAWPLIINSSGYASFSSSNALDFSEVSGLEAYIASAASSSSITLTQVNEAQAGTGLILKGTAGTTYEIPVIASSEQDKGILTAALTATDPSGDVYVLSDGEFHPLNSDITIPAGKAYLDASYVGSGSRNLAIVFGGEDDGTTAIKNIKVGTEDNVYYNLQGQRVLYPTKGLYIVNGKKVIVK